MSTLMHLPYQEYRIGYVLWLLSQQQFDTKIILDVLHMSLPYTEAAVFGPVHIQKCHQDNTVS